MSDVQVCGLLCILHLCVCEQCEVCVNVLHSDMYEVLKCVC